MNLISISNLKVNPAKAINSAEELPVAIQKRNKIKAYLIGKDLYENLVTYIENHIDQEAVKKTNFKKGVDFEKVASDLGI